ncbi:hypothetical protein ACFSQT_12000 [Mesorhizobium calcicola]|uniref:Uncharacterized protein n=1 Tax=Mesorhizobium calcicola TaxID=1300310 RepID=A0ABW4WB42_9HYPH
MKRRVSKSRNRGINPQAVEAFKAGDNATLRQALKIRPWEPSPLEVDGPQPPDWARNDGTAWTACWPNAWALRQELEEASKAIIRGTRT